MPGGPYLCKGGERAPSFLIITKAKPDSCVSRKIKKKKQGGITNRSQLYKQEPNLEGGGGVALPVIDLSGGVKGCWPCRCHRKKRKGEESSPCYLSGLSAAGKHFLWHGYLAGARWRGCRKTGRASEEKGVLCIRAEIDHS